MQEEIGFSLKNFIIKRYPLISIKDGVDGGIRTRDRTLRRRVLYPAELRRQLQRDL